ncbi:MAG: cation transporter [Candidatus Kapabacteria bacterium]|nr:cation transporter [Ignavibacteriota bacterium]MCW5884867.1 cation transporter [Candidatus Kapabacteria bacterium]
MEHNHNNFENKIDYNNAFAFGIILNWAYVVFEFVFGLRINSMALIADASHNLGDVLGLLLAWGASYLAKTSATNQRTYGLRKSTVLAALFNAIILLIAVGAISIEAVRKIITPEPLQGTTMMIVAGIGVVINALTAVLFLKGKNKDINIKGAFLHMSADAGVSLAIVGAGLLINLTGFYLLDPIISFVVVIVIVIGTWNLLKESFFLSMDAVPKNIDYENVFKYFKSIDGVKEVHDLHIWAMSTTETALTVHLVMPSSKIEENFLYKINHNLHHDFNIGHSTIQIEKDNQYRNCNKNEI